MSAATRARDLVREAGGPELVERLGHLDALPARPTAVRVPEPDPDARPDADVLIAGGGLSLLYAGTLAARGLRVIVVERARAGVAHREWNASLPELGALVRAGVVTMDELESDLIVARYREGICRWHGGRTHVVRGVLDCAVDAAALLGRARSRAERLGVQFVDGASVTGHAGGRNAVAVQVKERSVERRIVARVMVDARGAASPFATADLVCPTVGGVLSGITVGDGPREIRPDVGEILVTTEDVEERRQHLWEAFPGRAGRTTVYLFYYARSEAPGPGRLLALYARFFARIGDYKSGALRLERPTFGFIPGWSRLSRPPESGHPRILLVGDAAARHSPLTFCGFGATLRSLAPATHAIARAVEGDRQDSIVDDAPVHRGTGALSLLLASPPAAPPLAHQLNALLDAAFSALGELGEASFARLLRDEMTAPEFVAFLLATSRRHPSVYREVFARLGPMATMRWSAGLARELARASLA